MLIPANLRTPVRKVPGGPSLKSLLAANPRALTLGIASARAVASVVECSGARIAASANGSCAVGATRLSLRDGRIFGVLCSGLGAVEQPTWVPPGQAVASYRYLETSAVLGPVVGSQGERSYGTQTFANPFDEPAVVEMNCVANSFNWRTSLAGGPWFKVGVFYFDLAPGQAFTVEGIRGTGSAQTLDVTDVYITVRGGSSDGYFLPPVPDWRTAPPRLSWSVSGLPWWGVIEAAARAGLWVRRASWAGARRVRYEAGAGTTRAVAVNADGQRVTTGDFGVAEFDGEDWEIITETEPPAVDLTDAVFSGPAGSVFFVVPGAEVPVPPTTPQPPPIGPVFPERGSGFVYMRDGETILVPAKDCDGREWTP